MNAFAVSDAKQDKHKGAEKLLLEAVEGQRHIPDDGHPHAQESQKNLIELYEAWGKPAHAEQRRAKLPREHATEK